MIRHTDLGSNPGLPRLGELWGKKAAGPREPESQRARLELAYTNNAYDLWRLADILSSQRPLSQTEMTELPGRVTTGLRISAGT